MFYGSTTSRIKWVSKGNWSTSAPGPGRRSSSLISKRSWSTTQQGNCSCMCLPQTPTKDPHRRPDRYRSFHHSNHSIISTIIWPTSWFTSVWQPLLHILYLKTNHACPCTRTQSTSTGIVASFPGPTQFSVNCLQYVHRESLGTRQTSSTWTR